MAQYEDVTKGALDRLRIAADAALSVGWENAYLLESAEVQTQVKLVKSVVERANRRIDDLEFRRNGRQTLPHEECSEAIQDLSTVYRQCSSEADNLVGLLKKQFPNYRAVIETAEMRANLTALVSKTIVRHVPPQSAETRRYSATARRDGRQQALRHGRPDTAWQDRKTGGHGRSSGVPAQRRCGLHDRTVGRGQRRSDHDSLTARAVID